MDAMSQRVMPACSDAVRYLWVGEGFLSAGPLLCRG
jgi:hypothetical protein